MAGSVVLALPMNVLPNIEFSPALDPKLIEAAHERHAGTGVKAVIKVKGKVGGEGKLYGLADSDHPLNVVFTYAKAEDHTLFIGFGDDPAKLDVLDRDAVQQVMQSFFPEMEVEDCFGYDWNLDPYSRGTWASYRPGWYGKYADHFGKAPGSRMFFAQGDHGEGWRGFIDGAIGGGGKAALLVKELLG